jgi:hypothetical protein
MSPNLTQPQERRVDSRISAGIAAIAVMVLALIAVAISDNWTPAAWGATAEWVTAGVAAAAE